MCVIKILNRLEKGDMFMKSKKTIIGFATAMAMTASVIPYSVSAEETTVYGLMNIPYSDFYAAEFGNSSNAYEVDAFSSATTSKWSKNGAGELFEGTFNQPNDDGTGKILGVTYPVAITQTDLDALGSENYNFTPLDSEPAAYKNVTISNSSAKFSAVQDSTPTTASEASIKLSTNTPWGDYLIDVENKPELGAIYGALIKTADGKTYAMRHEENIWRGELAWSSGIKTTEPHGNTLSYENFTDLMGATITEVTFITADGYTTVETDTYVPVKFVGEVVIGDSASGTGSTSLTLTAFPDDFQKTYTIADGFTVTDSEISYTNVQPGSYTLTVSDAGGKYAEVSGTFTLTTDSMPAAYGDKALIKAEGASDEEFATFLKNISKVSVNGTEYSASGKGAVKVISENGSIDFAASSRNGNVFDGSGNYTVSVKATGYTASLDFEIKESESPATTTVTTTISASTTSAKTTTTTTAKSTTTTQKSSGTDSPKTGDAGVALPAALLTLAGITTVAVKRKKK